MPSIFSRIVAGEIPCYRVAEDKNFLAFLDINPLTRGHTLVIPKKEIDYLFDLGDDQLGAMMVFAKKVARALKSSISCLRIGVTVIGLEVPHAHIHLIPINTMLDMEFSQPKKVFSHEELVVVAQKIQTAFEALS